MLDDLPLAQCEDMQDSAPTRCRHGSRGRKSNKEEVTEEANEEQGLSAEGAAPAKAAKATKAIKLGHAAVRTHSPYAAACTKSRADDLQK